MKQTPVPLPIHGGKAKTKAPPAKKANAVLSQELVNSDSDSDSDAQDTPTVTKSTERTKTIDPPSPSDSGSDSSSSEESDSESSVSDSQTEPKNKPVEEQARKAADQSHVVNFTPVHNFQAPRGFQAVPLQDADIAKASGPFSNLKGKELWHISAPAGVSLKSLREIVMQNVVDGHAVLQYNGSGYALSQIEEGDDTGRQVLIPRKDGYKAVPSKLTQRLRIQAVAPHAESPSVEGETDKGSEWSASITRSTIRAPRPQVKGLKMRFLPTGFTGESEGILGDSEDEMEVVADKSLRLPPTESESKKRKKTLASGDKEERRSKKAKKRAQEGA